MAPVYHSATLAGTTSSSECSLYLCEGLSSLNFISQGINVLGKTTTGALTMGGNIENIRGGLTRRKKKELKVESESMKLIIDKIIKSTNEPAYGTIVVAFDADSFGLKSTCTLISNIALLWPDLFESQKLKIKVLMTPKSDNGRSTTSLGSISDTTAVVFFGEVSHGQHLMDVHYNSKRDDFYLNIGFDLSSEWCAVRKGWIERKAKSQVNEQAGEQAEQPSSVTVKELIEKDLLRVYLSDVQRALPSALDGLSHRRRAVLHTFLKWDKTFKDKKVEQWAGLVEMVYNVPSAGLAKCITDMDGSVLQVEGSDGANSTRTRYLYASLSTTGRLLFPSDHLVNIEHSRTEHQFFLPIIPTLLLFGGKVICAGVNVTLPRCSLFTLAENCRLKLNQQDLLPFLSPEESSSEEKIIALDSSGKVIMFNSIISYFEYWFAEMLLLLCTSGTSKNDVVKKWKQQLGVLLSDILKRPAHLTTTIVLAEEDEELESDDGGSSSNLMSGQSTYGQSTYDQSYGDTASKSRDNEEGGGKSGEQWANDDDQVGANEWQDNLNNDNFEEEEEIITTEKQAPKKCDKKGKRSASAAFSPQSNHRSKRQAASTSTEETESTPPTPLPSRQRGQKFHCTDCDRTFRDFEKQQEHHLRDHQFFAPFKCIYLDCGATFYTKGAAGAHVQRCHKQSDKKKYSFVIDLRTV
ncbi:DNA topoisomerase 2-alpha [Tyrophagus putrescentiae]|nr:DNA topoisomerase 2-alpha [Tyrophagus putrescentiae]